MHAWVGRGPMRHQPPQAAEATCDDKSIDLVSHSTCADLVCFINDTDATLSTAASFIGKRLKAILGFSKAPNPRSNPHL